MKVLKEEFKKMKYDPVNVIPSTRMWVAYPVMASLSEVPTIEDDDIIISPSDITEPQHDKMIRTCILLAYHIGNPLAEIRDYPEKIAMAMHWAGIKDGSPAYRSVTANHKWFSETLNKMFVLAHSLQYQNWFTLCKIYHSVTLYLHRDLSLVDDPDKWITNSMNVQAKIESLLLNIAKLEANIFGSDEAIQAITPTIISNAGYWAEAGAKTFSIKEGFE